MPMIELTMWWWESPAASLPGKGGRRGLRQSPTGLRCEHNSSENTADATDTKYKVLKNRE